ncbi:TPA: hypothetical protein ACH3X1_008996 [Trebouxia sp. C0004]
MNSVMFDTPDYEASNQFYELQPDQPASVDLSDVLQQASSKRQKTGGAKANLLWGFFIKSAERKNSAHYWACCDFAVALAFVWKLSALLQIPLSQMHPCNAMVIAGVILDNEREVQEAEFREALAREPDVTLSFDGWKDISRSHLLAFTVVTPRSRSAFTYNVQDVSADRQTERGRGSGCPHS